MKMNALALLFAALLLCPLTGCGGAKSEKTPPATGKGPDGVTLSNDASGFTLLSEAVPDAILEIRYYSTYNFVGDRIDGYEQPVALLTKVAAASLRAVSDDLIQKGYLKRTPRGRMVTAKAYELLGLQNLMEQQMNSNGSNYLPGFGGVVPGPQGTLFD